MPLNCPNLHPERIRTALACHNARWQMLLQNWYSYGGVAWTPGMLITPDLRGRIESFLPWQEFASSLRCLARAFLPDDIWIPRLLHGKTLTSILEFWEELPEYSGRVILHEDNLLPFFCACADPPRFGTDVGRYPEQLVLLRNTAPSPVPSFLDLGCGIGLGTLEVADALNACTVVGITQEPLEAWMASTRQLPHDPTRSSHFAPFAYRQATFLAGDVLDFHSIARYNVILCNGLAGGRFLHQDNQLAQLLNIFEEHLAPGGLVALANAFHEGQRTYVHRLMELAYQSGWRISGNWHNLVMKRQF